MVRKTQSAFRERYYIKGLYSSAGFASTEVVIDSTLLHRNNLREFKISCQNPIFYRYMKISTIYKAHKSSLPRLLAYWGIQNPDYSLTYRTEIYAKRKLFFRFSLRKFRRQGDIKFSPVHSTIIFVSPLLYYEKMLFLQHFHHINAYMYLLAML